MGTASWSTELCGTSRCHKRPSGAGGSAPESDRTRAHRMGASGGRAKCDTPVRECSGEFRLAERPRRRHPRRDRCDVLPRSSPHDSERRARNHALRGSRNGSWARDLRSFRGRRTAAPLAGAGAAVRARAVPGAERVDRDRVLTRNPLAVMHVGSRLPTPESYPAAPKTGAISHLQNSISMVAGTWSRTQVARRPILADLSGRHIQTAPMRTRVACAAVFLARAIHLLRQRNQGMA